MCLYSTLRLNKKYTRTEKNGGIIPAIPDKRVQWIATGCGNCIECRKQKARGWQLRLLEDIKENKNGKFVTLTFSNEEYKKILEQLPNKNWEGLKHKEGYDRDNGLAKRAVRLFLERWRKEHKISLRHWLITELGHQGTENVHLHGIIWTSENWDKVRKHWKYGFMWPTKIEEKNNYVSSRTVNYIIKYVTKQHELYKGYKPIILTTPGIGECYVRQHNSKLNIYNGKKTIETYTTSTGHKMAMPTYWRNKIYSNEERENLWLQKLDKNVRYVCGEKIKIDTNEEGYWKLVEWHRTRTRELGYSDPETIWKRKKYEEDRRNMMNSNRIQ